MKRLLLLLFLLAASPALRAQNYDAPEVVISNEKANIGGTVYYLHKVLPKQTVFSICKAYGITSDDLNASNPDLKDGLKAGALLFIPVEKAHIPDTAEKPAPAVKKDSTPAAAVPGPETEVESTDAEKVLVVEQVIEHRVRWYDSVSGIARKYGVSEKTLLDYNGLKQGESIKGKVLLIPVMGSADGEENLAELPADIEEKVAAAEEQPEAPMTPVPKLRKFTADEPMHIALVLPFNLSGTSSAQFLNFYAGALMAVQEQKNKGAHLVLNVYDLSGGSAGILADPKFRESDLIVGPVEAATLAPFLAFSEENGIPLVSPLDQKVDSLVDSHPFLFQAPASVNVQVANLVRSLNARHDETVILIAGTSEEDRKLAGQMEALLQADGISYRKASASEVAGLAGSGARRTPAKVLIGSENKTFTADVIRSLNSLVKQRNIPVEIWCTNRVRNYETSDPDALFNLRTHTSAPYFVDYSNPKDQDFVRQYRALYYAEPDDFAFQGYDVFTCFIASAMQQGTSFFSHAEESPAELLHCNFHFVREDEKGGWRNSATRNLMYNKEDFSISISK